MVSKFVLVVGILAIVSVEAADITAHDGCFLTQPMCNQNERFVCTSNNKKPDYQHFAGKYGVDPPKNGGPYRRMCVCKHHYKSECCKDRNQV